MREEQLRATEQAKLKMPGYRAEWEERARDLLEELRPNEFRELTEAGTLSERVRAMAAATEALLWTLLERGMDLEEALQEATEQTLQVEPEPESFEVEEAEARTEELVGNWLDRTPPTKAK